MKYLIGCMMMMATMMPNALLANEDALTYNLKIVKYDDLLKTVQEAEVLDAENSPVCTATSFRSIEKFQVADCGPYDLIAVMKVNWGYPKFVFHLYEKNENQAFATASIKLSQCTVKRSDHWKKISFQNSFSGNW